MTPNALDRDRLCLPNVYVRLAYKAPNTKPCFVVNVEVLAGNGDLHEGANDYAFCAAADVALSDQPLHVFIGHHHTLPLLGGYS